MGLSLYKEKIYPATDIQKQFWLASRSFPESSAFNIPSLFCIEGKLNIEFLEKAFNKVVERHPVLRTNFKTMSGELFQVVHPEKEILIQHSNFCGRSWTEIKENIDKDKAKIFNLKNDILLRVYIYKSKDEKFYLLIVMHHIITDLFSKDLLGTEISLIYNSLTRNQKIDLPRPAKNFNDYALYHKDWLETDQCLSMLSFWEEKLKGRKGFLELPYSRQRPPVQSIKGTALPFSLSKDFTEQLKKFSKKNRVNNYLTLLTVWFILLSRYSSQEEIIVGVPLSNRQIDEFKNVMGCLVSILPVSVDIGDTTGFIDLLKQVRMGMLHAHRNQRVSFQAIIERTQPERDAAYNPLFQAGFTFEHPMNIDLNATRCMSMPVHSGGSQLDIFAVLWESEAGIKGYIEYCTDLFDESLILRMSDHYKNLLAAVMDDCTSPVEKLPILSLEERDEQIKKWNETQNDYPEYDGIHKAFESQVIKTPDYPAVSFGQAKLTYSELNKNANKLANYLIESGIKPGAPVGICMYRSIEMVTAIYGILKAGGAYVPLDPDYPYDRLLYMLDDTGVPLVLIQEDLSNILVKVSAKILCLDSQWELVEKFSENNPENKTNPDDPAYIIYTSGSTGKPKGVVNNHRGIINRILWMQDTFQISDKDSVLQKTPYSFDVSVWEFLWPLVAGSKLVIAPPDIHKDPSSLIKIIIENEITTLHFVPSMLQAFLGNPGAGKCKCIERVICSGEALSGDLEKKFFSVLNAELHNLYGPTEAAIDVTHWKCRKDYSRLSVPIGKPVSNTSIYILDKNMEPVPVGVKGELHIGGVQVADGYLNRDELNLRKFIKDSFSNEENSKLYKTGDLARYLEDGNIEYIGRIDSQVKVRGFRIELGEIESVLSEHPGVADAAVITRDLDKNDRRIEAYITPDTINSYTVRKLVSERNEENKTCMLYAVQDETHSGNPILNNSRSNPNKWYSVSSLVADVKKRLKRKLPGYMVPSSITIVPEMPLTPSGKIDRKKLHLIDTKKDSSEIYIEPQTETEKMLETLWTEILKIDKASVNESFFALGGNSLLCAYLASRILSKTGKEISVAKLFQYPTIRAFARFLDSETSDDKDDSEEKKKRVRLRKNNLNKKRKRRLNR